MTTTGEWLVSISTLDTGTALDHLLNIEGSGTGSGVVVHQICTINPYAVAYSGEISRAITYVEDSQMSLSYITPDTFSLTYVPNNTYSIAYEQEALEVVYGKGFQIVKVPVECVTNYMVSRIDEYVVNRNSEEIIIRG